MSSTSHASFSLGNDKHGIRVRLCPRESTSHVLYILVYGCVMYHTYNQKAIGYLGSVAFLSIYRSCYRSELYVRMKSKSYFDFYYAQEGLSRLSSRDYWSSEFVDMI